MTFKLENIKVEGNKKQSIIGDYSFNVKYGLREDRTFFGPCHCNMDPYPDSCRTDGEDDCSCDAYTSCNSDCSPDSGDQ
jgi:hypothetical protein